MAQARIAIRQRLALPQGIFMSDKSDDAKLPLGGTNRDTLVALFRGGIGAVPFVGSILAEIVGMFIPEQRIERLETYVKALAEQLAGKDQEELRARMTYPDNIDLFEEGALQSTRALSEDRRLRIAMLVAYGISGAEAARIEAKRLLALLREIDDDQLIILSSYLHKHRDDGSFWEKHKAVLEPVGAHIGSSREELDRDAMASLARDQLLRLGLIRERYRTPQRGENPEFDASTGRVKAISHELTTIGRMLLTHIGLAEPGEY